MRAQRTYAPAEICEIYGIARSTLFRWEAEGVIPTVARDITNQRRYTHEHIRAINKRQYGQLRQRFERALQSEDRLIQTEIMECLSLRKFMEGDVTGLYELGESPSLTPRTIRQLLRAAIEECEPTDALFSEILEVILKNTRVKSRPVTGRNHV
jgi:DNA-binding transcriptional MerR regulator